MRPQILVIGSANMDLVVRAEWIAGPGETVLGEAFRQIPGGKGANQAVAAARLGAEVFFLGRVGRDAFGDALAAGLEKEGIKLDLLRHDREAPTGVALISVDAQGQNAITVAPGANGQVSAEDVMDAAAVFAVTSAVVVQLEIPLPTVLAALETARACGVRTLLNPAPFRHTDALPDGLLACVDVLIPNEHEAAALLGYATTDGLVWEEVVARLLAKGVGAVIVTLGAEGCVLADKTGTRRLPAHPVKAIDTTAAGDCFTGALAVALAEGRSLDDAARFACVAASLSVTRFGAQPSLPTRAEVEALLPGAGYAADSTEVPGVVGGSGRHELRVGRLNPAA